MAVINEKVSDKIFQLTICLSCTPFVSGDRTIISTYQPYSYETSILLPKVIIGPLFPSHSLREMDVSGVKLKHVNMFRQVPQNLLEFWTIAFANTLLHCESKLLIQKTQVNPLSLEKSHVQVNSAPPE